MTLFIIGAGAIIVVVIIAVTLSTRRPQRAGRHAARGGWAADGYDDVPTDNDGAETAAFFAAEWPAGIAREPVPQVHHDGAWDTEILPAPLAEAPAYPPDEFLTVPVAPAPVSPRRVPVQVLSRQRFRFTRPQRPVLPPMAAPALAVAAALTAMAQRVAATDRGEIMRLLAVNQQLRRDVEHLRPAGDELAALREANRELQDRLDFAHLFDAGVQYSDWDWKTDSGILRLRAADLAAMDKEMAA